MKEKKKIPWGLIYVGLTVVVMIVFGLVNTESVSYTHLTLPTKLEV